MSGGLSEVAAPPGGTTPSGHGQDVEGETIAVHTRTNTARAM